MNPRPQVAVLCAPATGAGTACWTGRAGGAARRLQRSVELLTDCQAVIASRIGPGAGELLADRGIRAFAVAEPVDTALRRLIASGVLTEPLQRRIAPGRYWPARQNEGTAPS